jgi:hypothetical protein
MGIGQRVGAEAVEAHIRQALGIPPGLGEDLAQLALDAGQLLRAQAVPAERGQVPGGGPARRGGIRQYGWVGTRQLREPGGGRQIVQAQDTARL